MVSMAPKKNHSAGKDPFDFSEQIEELEALLDEEEDDTKREILKGILYQYRYNVNDYFEKMEEKNKRFPLIPPPPPRGSKKDAIRETYEISEYFRKNPKGSLKIVRGTKPIRELLERMDDSDLYNYCKYVQEYDVLLTNSRTKWIEAIHAAYFRDPSVFLYCVDPEQMDDVLSLPELADEETEYTGKAMPFLPLSCLATFDLKTATLTLASDYEELFSKITPSKLKHANKRVREFDPAMDVLMHHFGLIEMIEVPGLLKDLFQIEMSEKLCFSLMYFRLSIPKKYQTLTNLRDGRHFISEIGLDLNKIMPGMNVGEFLVPYFPPNQYQLEQWKKTGNYMDVYPGWSYLLGFLALHMGMKMEEAKDECDLYYQDVRNGATLNEMMDDLMGSSEGNRQLIPRMMIWECALHCVLGTALPGLKGANRIVTSQMMYFMKDDSFVDDPVKAENIKPDTHIEKMPENLQRELGSRLFTLETTDLEPIKGIVDLYPDNIDLNYIYGVANERLGRLGQAIEIFEKVDRLMKGKDPLLKSIIQLCRDGKIRKPVSIRSDGTLIL